MDEEDPKVIKELIDLIKKAGGIEQLEKQFNLESGSKSTQQQTPTIQPLISKSLYEKVLNSASGRSFLPKNRYSFSTQRNTTGTDSSAESGKTSTGNNKYSSVIRNSRPGPQNDGLDKLPDYDGVIRERPQYVTINRQGGTQSANKRVQNDDNDNDDDSDEGTEEEIKPKQSNSSRFSTTVHPQYVNIQRTRPTPTKSSAEENVHNDEEDTIANRKQYNFLDRKRNQGQQNEAGVTG